MALPRRIANDVAVANNERARRRRQRARRRLARNAVVPISREVSSHYRRSPANEIELKTADESVGVDGVFSEDLVRFCEAVVHPFGPEAIGATLPDHYQELVIPITDRLEIDLTPELFNIVGSWEDDPGVQLTGVFVWFQPRCLAAGFASTQENDSAVTFPTMPYLGVDDALSALNQDVITNEYYLCLTGIWQVTGTSTNAPITYGFYNPGTPVGTLISPIYYALQYTRFKNVASNADKMRILGAGLKMWSEQAPINTGGYCVSGWATVEDIAEALQWTGVGTNPAPANPGALKAFQPKIKFAVRSPGVKGATARYSPLQTADQAESEYPLVPSRLYDLVPNPQTPWIPFPDYIVTRPNADLAINDVITPGSYVPCIFWQFNTTDDSANANGVYTIKLMSMVHAEAGPTGECPFMAKKSAVDPAAAHAKMMLENLDVFPVAASGHSFKSFMGKTRRVLAHVSKGVGHFTKILAVADKFASELM